MLNTLANRTLRDPPACATSRSGTRANPIMSSPDSMSWSQTPNSSSEAPRTSTVIVVANAHTGDSVRSMCGVCATCCPFTDTTQYGSLAKQTTTAQQPHPPCEVPLPCWCDCGMDERTWFRSRPGRAHRTPTQPPNRTLPPLPCLACSHQEGCPAPLAHPRRVSSGDGATWAPLPVADDTTRRGLKEGSIVLFLMAKWHWSLGLVSGLALASSTHAA